MESNILSHSIHHTTLYNATDRFFPFLSCVEENQFYWYHSDFRRYPGRSVRAGSGWNSTEITGSGKQYSGPEIIGIFRLFSCHIRPETTGKAVGKNPATFHPDMCLQNLPYMTGSRHRFRYCSRWFLYSKMILTYMLAISGTVPNYE
jgi:hypothetical protein